MKIIEGLKHGSAEWLAWRQGGIGSSDVAAIMGICPYRTAADVYLDKIGQGKNEKNAWMQRGIHYEDEARQVFTRSHPCDNWGPLNIEHADNPLFKASLDGYSTLSQSILEIKVPGRKTLDMARYGQIPMHYLIQMQWQMYVADKWKAYYFCYCPDTLESYTVEVFPDAELREKMLMKVNQFIEDWKSGTVPLKKTTTVQDDATQKILKELLLLKDQEKKIKAEYQELLEQLLTELGTESSYETENVCLCRSERQNIDYRAAAIDAKVDLEKYKKAVTVSWTIRDKRVKEDV